MIVLQASQDDDDDDGLFDHWEIANGLDPFDNWRRTGSAGTVCPPFLAPLAKDCHHYDS